MKTLTIVIDEYGGDECLYIDGQAWQSTGETTVYACNIAEAAGDDPVLIRHVRVNCSGGWPERLEDLKLTDGAQPV